MKSSTRTLLCLVMTMLMGIATAEEGAASEPRYEIKHSFKPPFFLVRGTNLPFWDHGGSTVITDTYVRLTPALNSRQGWLWNTVPSKMNNWQVEIEFRVGGGGKLGADGFAFWYVKERSFGGDCFGAAPKWEGLGLIFDTFDNDNMKDNPTILAAVNDGTREWSNDADGKNLAQAFHQVFYRNPFRPCKVQITYVNKSLRVNVDVSRSGTWENIVYLDNVNLPPGYYFGVTAATGGLSDNHDVFSFVTYNFDPAPAFDEEQLQREVQEQQQAQKQTEEQNQQQQQQQQQQEHEHPPQKPIDTPTPENHEHTQQQQEEPEKPAPVDNQEYKDLLNKLQAVSNPDSDDGNQARHHTQPADTQQQQQQQEPPKPVQQQQQQQPPPAQVDDKLLKEMKEQQEVFAASLKLVMQAIQKIMEKQQDLDYNLAQQLTKVDSLSNSQKVFASALNSLLESKITKQDIASIDHSDKFNALFRDTGNIKDVALEIKNLVRTRLTTPTDDLAKSVSEMAKEIAAVKYQLEHASSGSQQLATQLRESTQSLSNTVEKNTSWGFLTYFLLSQVLFGAAFLLWRRYRDEQSKKFL